MKTVKIDTGCHELRILVHGIPAPQGSKRHVGGGVMIETCKALKPWRETVKWAVLDMRERGENAVMVDGPISANIQFYLPRPKSRPKRECYPDRKPDLDKLIRGIFDAMSQVGVWRDDAQVVSLITHKVYVGDGQLAAMSTPGCLIALTALSLVPATR